MSHSAMCQHYAHLVQESSHSESLSTLAFGGRVSEIALGAAKKNVESGAIFEAREAAKGMDAAASRERQARKGAESRASTAEAALEAARREVETLQVSMLGRNSGQVLAADHELHWHGRSAVKPGHRR